jgi:hypothetical protein
VHLYTATSAARLTQLRMENDITSKSDLPGKAVETWEPYVGLLRKYSIDAVGLEWYVGWQLRHACLGCW